MTHKELMKMLQQMSMHESQSKILATSEKHQRQYAMRAFNVTKKQINIKNINIRTKHK